jgi:ABC-2 type transport system permease protein
VNVRPSNVIRLGIKELRSLRADPVLLLIIVWSLTFAVYAVATGTKTEVERGAVAIVDEDQSELSRRIAGAHLHPYFREPVEISASDIDPSMDSGKFVFVIEIPPKFEADVLAGRRPTAQINIDATAVAQAFNGATYIQNIIMREVLSVASRREGSTALPVEFVVRSKFNPNVRSEWFTSVMQVINNVTILSIILTGAALLRERERGTVEHLLVMPVTPTEIMLAKIWANGAVIVVAAALSLWFVVRGLLQVPLAGSVALFVAGTIVYQISIAALGILLATFTGTMGQFGLLAIPVLVVLNLLTGSTTPYETMPEWLQTVMQVTPTTHFVSFAQGVLYRGAGVDIVWKQLLTMLAIGLIYFAVSLARFRTAIASFR